MATRTMAGSVQRPEDRRHERQASGNRSAPFAALQCEVKTTSAKIGEQHKLPKMGRQGGGQARVTLLWLARPTRRADRHIEPLHEPRRCAARRMLERVVFDPHSSLPTVVQDHVAAEAAYVDAEALEVDHAVAAVRLYAVDKVASPARCRRDQRSAHRLRAADLREAFAAVDGGGNTLRRGLDLAKTSASRRRTRRTR